MQKKKYIWSNDDQDYEMFSDTPPDSDAIEKDDRNPIDFSYHPDAYEDDEEVLDRNLGLVEKLGLPKNKEVRIDFTVSGDPYYLVVKNLDNGFYKGVVISNDRQDIDPGDLYMLKEKYVKLICNKIKEGN